MHSLLRLIAGIMHSSLRLIAELSIAHCGLLRLIAGYSAPPDGRAPGTSRPQIRLLRGIAGHCGSLRGIHRASRRPLAELKRPWIRGLLIAGYIAECCGYCGSWRVLEGNCGFLRLWRVSAGYCGLLRVSAGGCGLLPSLRLLRVIYIYMYITQAATWIDSQII